VAAGKSLIRLAVFGCPIAHSLSPAIHRQFANQLGLAVDYQAIAATLEEFPKRLQQFAAGGASGCNVTVPLKLAAFEAAHELSAAARLAKAVNTLVFRQPDYWYGDNTDGAGLVRDLQHLLPRGLSGQRILLIGAGGAAAGVLGPLLEQSPAELLIANRRADKANALVQGFARLGPVRACALAELQTEQPFDVLINATSLGHQGLAPEIARSCFSPQSFCYDLNYGAAARPWQKICEERGVKFSDGLGMLVKQAALAFELWTGHLPATSEVLDSLRGKFAVQ